MKREDMPLKDEINTDNKGRFRIRYLYLAIFVMVIVSGFILGFFMLSAKYTFFPVKGIVFYGNKHLPEAELNAMTRINAGESLLGLSPKKISGRLMESPWIKAVSIRKDFPDKILIQIQETVPFAILDVKGQTFFIDERGRKLEIMKENSVPFLPVIYSEPQNNVNFMEALALAKVLAVKKIATERGRVEIIANGKNPEDMSLIIDGLVIKIGYGGYEQKLNSLFALEEEIRKRAIAVDYVDLRFANRVIVKPIKGIVK